MKMLKKIAKLEDSLNKVLEKLIALWLMLLHKILPQKIFDFKDRVITGSKQLIIDLKNWIIQSALAIYQWALSWIAKVQTLKQKLTAIDYSSKLKAKLIAVKDFLQKTPLKSQVKFASKSFKNISPRIQKLTDKLQKYPTDQLWIVSIAFLMVSSGIFGIYLSSKDIYQKEFPHRAPASIQEYDERPEYRLYQRKTVSFQNIKVPITVENVSDIDSITVDLSVRTSTRWARYYLENYETQLKDYFFTTVEPVVSDFPLEHEGKEILKEKVRVEINNFLRENGVEGEVEDVRILFIVAS